MSLLVRDVGTFGRRQDILVEEGRFASVPLIEEARAEHTIDGRGFLIRPAFIDLQLNGAFGHDLVEEPESVWEIARRLPAHGVGRFLPTIISSPPEALERMIAVLEAGPPPGFRGARPIGIHLEGPCLSPAAAGAHEKRHLRLPAERPEAMFHPLVRLVTLAPELEGAEDLITELRARGIAVAAGHSRARAADLARAKAAGLQAATHLFNAMSGLHHRDPGLAAAILDDRDIRCGIIADGLHVADSMLRLAHRLLGSERLFLVSDAVAGAGALPGRHRLAGQDVEVREDAVRLPDGTLAGSAALLDRCLMTMVRALDAVVSDLAPMVTSTPAAVIGEEASLAVGAPADFVLLESFTGRLRATVIGGEILHNAL